MSKTLVVFGATGNQGGSVIDYVLNHPDLSKVYHIRAVTRDPSSKTSQDLIGKGIDVVKGDVNNAQSIKGAVKGAQFAFITVPSGNLSQNDLLNSANISIDYTADKYVIEMRQTKTIVDAFIAAGGEYIIYSSVPSIKEISHGKYPNVGHWEAKADSQNYISQQPIKSAFFVPGSFMSNFTSYMSPKPLGDGTYGIFNLVGSEKLWPLIDVANDTGKWVGCVLASPDKYVGKELCAATKLYRSSEIADALSRATGKTVKWVQISEDQFRQFVPPESATAMVEMFQYMDEFGYYGADTAEKIKLGAEQASEKLTTLEEYLERTPLILE